MRFQTLQCININLTPGRFLTDYLHTFIILIILCYFSVKVFTLEEIGSLSKLFELLQNAAERHPVEGNEAGSYLTMTSKGVCVSKRDWVCVKCANLLKGIYFGIIHILSNFGLVIVSTHISTLIYQVLTLMFLLPQMDTGFFIKAFAASPSAVVPGYVVGGISYFAIPWGAGTLMSAVAVGLENNPIFPTFPRVRQNLL